MFGAMNSQLEAIAMPSERLRSSLARPHTLLTPLDERRHLIQHAVNRELGNPPPQDNIEDTPDKAKRRAILPIERKTGELTMRPHRYEAVNNR